MPTPGREGGQSVPAPRNRYWVWGSDSPEKVGVLCTKGEWMLGRYKHQRAAAFSKSLESLDSSIPRLKALCPPAGTAERDTVCKPLPLGAGPDCSTSPEDCKAPAR